MEDSRRVIDSPHEGTSRTDRMAEYRRFCEYNYVPIYSQQWWMDAICGSSWDVWLYTHGSDVLAAMPYYLEERKHGLYITKAPLTQNNGIIFKEDSTRGPIAEQRFQERVVTAADEHISSMGLAVYEQQYQTSFTNWLPFSWRGYQALPRYTYVVEDTASEEDMLSRMSGKQRGKVRKGGRNTSAIVELPADEFYDVHEDVFRRQGLPCPFSKELFLALESACRKKDRCVTLCALGPTGEPASVLFAVWDDRRLYQILGGSVNGSQRLDTYAGLIWEGMKLARAKGLAYDFEGSMIERISKSFREFGGEPQQYFRIRKVFSADVVRDEAEDRVARM